MGNGKISSGFLAFALVAALSATAAGNVVVTWDFTKGLHGWRGNPYVENLEVTAEGLAFDSTGIDPWIEGLPVNLRGEELTRVHVRMKSNAGAGGEVFFGKTFQAGQSVRFTVRDDGQWHDYALLIREPLGRGTRFRLDPGTEEGHIVVASIQVETLTPIELPSFEPPGRPGRMGNPPVTVRSGSLTLEHYGGGWGDFIVKVAGVEMAAGYDGDRIGAILEEEPQWLTVVLVDFKTTAGPNGHIICQAAAKDSAGGLWLLQRHFKAGAEAGTIIVETRFVVDGDRQVVHLPWLTLFPGLGTFGERKTQGLFAGLEYLADEPSSSEADITTPEHVRRAPDPVKITFPLMAVTHENRWIGLIWEPSELVAAVFDSPDRIYGSNAHVMALTAPAIGDNRFENDLIGNTPFELAANEPVRTQAVIIADTGGTVIPAVRKYVELHGLPAIPEFQGGFDAAVTLLAHGWLDSAINEGGIFRHAVWGESFKASPAADAIMYVDWLANHVQDPDLLSRLHAGRDLAVSRMPPGQPYISTVSHARTPTAPFIFGGVYPYVEQRQSEARNLLKRFDESGVKLYRPGKADYGATHFATHANGYAAVDVFRILEAATMSADPDLIEQGLALLDRQTALYANTVPRGAQTWEVPLHTPDILASAYMVKAYVLGYVISRNEEYLEQARYWAWTGVPFVYLVNPTQGEVGPYATIAVLGATNWKAPVWFGLPVQWCGLVYCSALHLLSEYDTEGPWATIAKGITATGLNMTWPVSDETRQGLLPDFFNLRVQRRDGPAINPGTVQAHVPELFGRDALYDVKKLASKGWFIHAPCAIRDLQEDEGSATFAVEGWGKEAFYVLLSGVEEKPRAVTVRPTAGDGQAAESTANAQYNSRQRLLAITLRGPSQIRVRY